MDCLANVVTRAVTRALSRITGRSRSRAIGLSLFPIGDTELRVIEGHLRKELDDLFGPLP